MTVTAAYTKNLTDPHRRRRSRRPPRRRQRPAAADSPPNKSSTSTGTPNAASATAEGCEVPSRLRWRATVTAAVGKFRGSNRGQGLPAA
jgi:hypothetical protein